MHKLIRFTLVMLIAGLLWKCSTTTEPDTENSEVTTVSTANVKSDGNQYFSFASGEVSSAAGNGYDLEFEFWDLLCTARFALIAFTFPFPYL